MKAWKVLLIVVFFVYLISPVPYCRPSIEKINPEEAVYSKQEILNTKMQEITLLKVSGISMIPAIKNNSECICLKKENYSVGDIIFFFSNGLGISHRIVFFGDKFITKGDNNEFLDYPINKKDVICYVPLVPRYRVLFGI